MQVVIATLYKVSLDAKAECPDKTPSWLGASPDSQSTSFLFIISIILCIPVYYDGWCNLALPAEGEHF